MPEIQIIETVPKIKMFLIHNLNVWLCQAETLCFSR